MKALYLIGEPGVGKTTLMNGLLDPYHRGHPVQLNGVLWGEPLDVGGPVLGVHLGKKRPGHGGTDALGMGVQPYAIVWASRPDLPGEVYGEGQRLANVRFLTHLASRGRLLVIHLYGPEVAERQRKARGSKQNVSWLAGAQTRARNLADELAISGVEVLTLEAGPNAFPDAAAAWDGFRARVEV